jgi:arginyl-tRNA synthetase
MRADRLVAILLLLQDRGQVTAAEVARELEVSERTARRDLDALGVAGLPIYSTQGRNGGWRLAAYHRNKFLVRGFDRVINVWGADHQGQVPSLLAGVEALGVEKGRLEVRLGQMVSLASGRIGKRLGNAVDLDDLVDDIGPDVMRLLSLVASPDQSPTIDLDKVRGESRESPVYYVQYAHARIHSIGKKAGELGVHRADLGGVDLSPLAHPREIELLRTLSTLPEVVELACVERAPHKVTAWVRELADRFHGFYHDCRVLGDDVDPATTQARLWLVEASRIGFAVGLDLLGVAAPESM